MKPTINIAITGDMIINKRVSVCREEGFLSIIDILKSADVAYTHLETLIHDYVGPEVYPAAESGFTWMRSPRFITEELKWMGINLLSHASNHCLDYSYGGLFSTLAALDNAGLVHAGTGRNLADAREAAYLETTAGRMALISMSSSFTRWSRAGEATRDVNGRPGINPLRYYYSVDSETLELIKLLAIKLGWWVRHEDGAWLFHDAASHVATYKFVEGSGSGVRTIADEEDMKGNLRSIADAKKQADLVMVHVHNHEFNPEKGGYAPSQFVVDFAKACVDAGANIFIGQGSHTPLRGVEIYKNTPIFYDPGDFMHMSGTVTRLPYDFYSRIKNQLKAPVWESTTADAVDARSSLPKSINPPGGNFVAPVIGGVVPVCSFTSGKLTELKLYPFTILNNPRVLYGIPVLAKGDLARRIIEHLNTLSSDYNTHIELRNDIGFVKIS